MKLISTSAMLLVMASATNTWAGEGIAAPARPLTEPRQIDSPVRAAASAVPIADLFYARESYDASVAPDGRDLVISTNLTGRYNLWLVPLAGGFPLQLTRSDERQWGTAFSPDGKTIVFASDRAGAEMFDLYAVPRAGGATVNLTSTDDATESGAVFSPDGRWLAFSKRLKTAPSANIAVMDFGSRQVRTLTNEKLPDMQWNPVGFSSDSTQIIANRQEITGATSTIWRIDVASGTATPLLGHVNSRANLAVDRSPDGRWLSLTTETPEGRRQAALYDMQSDRMVLLHPDDWEQHAGHFSPDSARVLFVSNVDGRQSVYLYDIGSGRSEELPLPAGANADYFGKLPAFTADGKRVIFPHESGTQTVDYWSFDLQSRQLTQVTRLGLASFGADSVPATRVVHYRSADGTTISALLWVPFNAPRDGSSPAVVLAHGGPTGQTEDRFDADAVALASRGYFVIAPNPRGSTGYGRAFEEANRRDLGGGDLQDYVAGARFLVATGYVDASRIGITGTSYGGFMTIMALGRAPEVFAAGVEVCGITNWFSMYERGSPALRAYQMGLIGDPVKDRAIYEASSPLTYLHQVRGSLLALQGENDPRVPKNEAEQVVATLQRFGRTVDAKYYPDEGHGFSKRENQIDALERTVMWFDQHMPKRNAGLESLNWLESPRDPRALEWARAQTRRSQEELQKKPAYAPVVAELRATLKASAPIPEVALLGPRAVRFVRDSDNPHGVLQVAERSASGVGAWRTVLDVGALRKAEGKPYELQWNAMKDACLAPAYDRCLLRLSPGGGDEVELREFDLSLGQFVEGGFRTPAARTFAVWLDQNRLAICHTLFDSPKTAAGWGANVRIWRRGNELRTAKTVFQAQPSDAILELNGIGEGTQRRAVAMRAIDYSHFEMTLIAPDGATTPVELPSRLKPFGLLATTARHLIVQLAEDADVGGRRIPAETVVAYDITGKSSARGQVVYSPKEGEFLNDPVFGVASTRNALYFIATRRLVPHLISATPSPHEWKAREEFAAEVGQSLKVGGADPVGSDVIVQTTGFLTPARLELWHPGSRRVLLQAETAAFDASRFVAEVRTATSKDGTPIDYYLVRPRDTHPGSPIPTLMTGYGAFGISFTPGYLDYEVGGRSLKVWLERGGALVLPAIRGGGERGEAWHQAAIRERRQVSYDDFAAVAESLVKSGFTTPSHLGVFGSSNGGLLAATMGTERPDLFGAVVSDVPLTDMLRFPKMGMGAAWIDEYGNPDDPADAKVLRAYSPLQNVREGVRYPPFLITISTEDNRVGPGHARKLAARLLQVGSTVYFLEDDEGGHGVSDPLTRPEVMGARMTFFIDALMRN
jgi:prolyl oligopeptidase